MTSHKKNKENGASLARGCPASDPNCWLPEASAAGSDAEPLPAGPERLGGGGGVRREDGPEWVGLLVRKQPQPRFGSRWGPAHTAQKPRSYRGE